jgi:hypothetical protein
MSHDNGVAHVAQQAVDATLATVGWNTTKLSAAGAVAGWLLSANGAALIGILGVLIGLFMQWHFGRRRDKREQSESDLRLQLMRDKIAMHDEAERLLP